MFEGISKILRNGMSTYLDACIIRFPWLELDGTRGLGPGLQYNLLGASCDLATTYKCVEARSVKGVTRVRPCKGGL